jgi:hypothetical protein
MESPMPIHLISSIDTKDFGGYTLRVGDLNADGAPDILLAQSIYGTRVITCLTAIDLAGTVLWQSGTPHADNGRNYSDLPVQVYDFDGDGANEVVWVKQADYAEPILTRDWARERARRYEGHATVNVLDAATGKAKRTFAIPAPADDSLLFADLTGRGRRQDLVVKDRYWNLWGISHEGQTLWHWAGPTGHFPAVADLDGNGRDEVFTGYALLDHDGRSIFVKPFKPGGDGGEHADAVVVHHAPDGQWRLIHGNGGVHCCRVDGSELWSAPLAEAQHVTVGHFRDDSPWQVVAINRGRKRTVDDVATLYLFDHDGRELWRQTSPPGSWAAMGTRINWTGGPDSWLVGRTAIHGTDRPTLIYDGDGEVIDELPMVRSPRQASGKPLYTIALPADMWGDSRDEVIVFNPHGLCVYANARACSTQRQYNATHYLG